MAQSPSPSSKLPQSATKQVAPGRSFQKDDFPIIRRACLNLGVCVIVAICLVAGVRFVLGQQQDRQLQAETELTQVQEKLLVISSEKHDIDQYQPSYLAAIKRGFVGDEKRLDLVEHVKAIQEKRQLLPLSYEIFPRQSVQLDPSVLMGELELRASRIAIHVPLLHEGDLLNFLADLSHLGVFVPKTCSMTAKTNVEPNLVMPRLDGECDLYWLSVGRKAITEVAPTPAPPQ